MFILDTNVLSAMMAKMPSPEVSAWIAGQSETALFTTAISQAEILSGLAVMTDGRRRSALEGAARAMFSEDFDGRVLAFDAKAAVSYANIFAVRQKAGRPASVLDLMIAAIAAAHGASVVTRDVSGFDGCGIGVVNPWQASEQ